MKKSIIVLLLSGIASFVVCGNENQQPKEPKDPFEFTRRTREMLGRSFMTTRTVSDHLMINQQLWHNFIYSEASYAFNIIGLYAHSLLASKSARYFLIDGVNELLIAGDNSPSAPLRNVRAEWLHLPSNFSGFMTITPEQTQYGVSLSALVSLDKIFDISLFDEYWLSITIPVIHVRNSLNLQQCGVENPGTIAPRNIIEAFDQQFWRNGKIVPERSITRLTEFKFMLGKTFMVHNYYEIGYYSVLVIPTGNKENSEFLFDSVAGNNRHIGIGGGTNFQLLLNQHPEKLAWTFFANLEGIFQIRNKQCRTFDLKNKPWSRYMLYVERNMPANQTIPGVNLLTFRTVVRPYGFADFSTGFRFNTDRVEFEFGYNVWGGGGERVQIELPRQTDLNPFNRNFGIAGNPQQLMPIPTTAVTASRSTIAEQAPPDTDENGNQVFVFLRERDLDIVSGEAGSILNQTFHLAIGYTHCDEFINFIAGGGGFAEFAHKNSTLPMWGLWLKMGAAY